MIEFNPETCDELKWGSYIPALMTAIVMSEGPVLELGVGHFSTPLLHAVCGALGRKLYSVEENLEWYQAFEKYNNGLLWHAVTRSNYSEAPREFKWGVVFIDQSPGGKCRADAFDRYLPISNFVIVHDFHLENSEHILPLMEGVRHHVTTTYSPPTLIATKHKFIPHAILDL